MFLNANLSVQKLAKMFHRHRELLANCFDCRRAGVLRAHGTGTSK